MNHYKEKNKKTLFVLSLFLLSTYNPLALANGGDTKGGGDPACEGKFKDTRDFVRDWLNANVQYVSGQIDGNEFWRRLDDYKINCPLLATSDRSNARGSNRRLRRLTVNGLEKTFKIDTANKLITIDFAKAVSMDDASWQVGVCHEGLIEMQLEKTGNYDISRIFFHVGSQEGYQYLEDLKPFYSILITKRKDGDWSPVTPNLGAKSLSENEWCTIRNSSRQASGLSSLPCNSGPSSLNDSRIEYKDTLTRQQRDQIIDEAFEKTKRELNPSNGPFGKVQFRDQIAKINAREQSLLDQEFEDAVICIRNPSCQRTDEEAEIIYSIVMNKASKVLRSLDSSWDERRTANGLVIQVTTWQLKRTLKSITGK